MSNSLTAQDQFQYAIGFDGDERVSRVIQTSDGDYLVATGTYSVGAGDRDIMILKINNEGEVLWKKIMGTTNRNVVRRIIEVNPNKFFFLSWIAHSGTEDNWYLFSIDANGNLLEEKFVGGTDDDEIHGITSIGANEFIAVGSTRSFPVSGSCNFTISKLDENFNFSWMKIIGSGIQDFSGNVIQTSDGNLVLSGFNRTGSSNSDNIVVMKLDTDANVLWSKQIAGNNAERSFDLIETPDNHLLITGFTNSFGAGDFDAIVIKMDLDGNHIWSKTIGGSGDEKVYEITASQNNTYFLAGNTSSCGNGGYDVLFLEIDEDGNLLKGKTYGGEEDDMEGHHDITQDGGIIISGHTKSFGAGEYDLYLIKTDENGNSCCSNEIENISVLQANPAISNLSYTSGNQIGYPNHDIIYDNSIPEQFTICLDSIILSGPDSICPFAENVEYTVEPASALDFEWTVPEGSTISSYQGDSSILVNFENNPGYVIVTSGLCELVSDSIYVEISNIPPVFLGNDTTLCSNEGFLLDPAGYYSTYLWPDGSSDSSFLVQGSGWYWVEVTDEFGCISIDSIFIELFPYDAVNLGNDTLICNGDSFYLNAGSGFISYLWNDGSTDSLFYVDTTGTYWVEVINIFGCSSYDSINVDFYPIAFEAIELGNDTTLCPGETLLLNVGSGYTFIEWQNGSNDTSMLVTAQGTYYVFAENPCSSGSDTIFIDYFPVNNIYLGNDTVLCKGDFLYLDPGFGFLSFIWQDGSTNQNLYAGESGVYWVQVEDNNYCSASDTILLEFTQPEIYIGNDTSICSGTAITFYIPEIFISYLWQDNSEENVCTADTCGTYWCFVTDSIGCTGSDSIEIFLQHLPEPDLGPDQQICFGDTVILKVDSQMDCQDFIWSDGSTDSTLIISETGFYSITASNNCGENHDTIMVQSLILPFVNLGNDTILIQNSEFELNAGSGFESYLWNDGSENQYLFIYEAGVYWVNVFDGYCKNSDTINIEPVNCDLFIPNVFTPNNDGPNDYFFADASDDIFDLSLQVYNRWGEKIWETENKEEKWDGTRNGNPAAEGVYFWTIKYNCLGYTGEISRKGTVTLLR